VSNAEYRLPGYPGYLKEFLVLEYPGNWFEYSVSQIFIFLLEKMHMKPVFSTHSMNLIFNFVNFILIKNSIKS
jgi:hypothetical protein